MQAKRQAWNALNMSHIQRYLLWWMMRFPSLQRRGFVTAHPPYDSRLSPNRPAPVCFMSPNMDGGESERGDLLLLRFFRGALMSSRRPKEILFQAFFRAHIFELVQFFLKYQIRQTSMETFATRRTPWLSPGKVQLVVFPGSFWNHSESFF